MAPDKFTPVRKLARRMLSDALRDTCRCPDADCGKHWQWEALSRVPPGWGDNKEHLRRAAFMHAARSLGHSGYAVEQAADAFARQ